MDTFGDRLKSLRAAQSQAAFAKSLGVPQMTLSNYETGKSEPKFGFIHEICTRFKVSSDWLLFGNAPHRPGSPAPTAQDHAPALHAPAERPAGAQESPCARCTKLEAELEIERRERRELTSEVRHLWKENSELREKCARLEERQYRMGMQHGDAETHGGAG